PALGPSGLGAGGFGAPAGTMGQLVPQQHMLTMGAGAAQMTQPASKYDLFRSVNPHAPSIFSGAPLQQPQMQLQVQPQMPQGMSGAMALQVPAGFPAGASQAQHPPGPTGIFAMANPTLAHQAPAMMPGFQQQPQPQQQQQQQQQMFGTQPQWR
ncbi:hypothetical protein IWQ56_006077, partial [Coemansia nantahalensis]